MTQQKKQIEHLKVTDIPILFINLADDSEKRVFLETELRIAGFKDVSRVAAIREKPSALGLAISHRRALEARRPPFIVLEDDVGLAWFREIIEVPSDADAAYLGTSNWALQSNRNVSRHIRAKRVGVLPLFRIWNMLSAHAILYLSERMVESNAQACDQAIANLGREEIDLRFAEIMPTLNVYCVEYPLFVQLPYPTSRSDAWKWTGLPLTGYGRDIRLPAGIRLPLNRLT